MSSNAAQESANQVQKGQEHPNESSVEIIGEASLEENQELDEEASETLSQDFGGTAFHSWNQRAKRLAPSSSTDVEEDEPSKPVTALHLWNTPQSPQTQRFFFLRACMLRDWWTTDMGPLPQHNVLMTESMYGDPWLEECEMSLVGVFGHTYKDTHLAVSHRWQTACHPDPWSGVELELCKFLDEHPSVQYIWHDFWCLPQKSLHKNWTPKNLSDDEELYVRKSLISLWSVFVSSHVLIFQDDQYLSRFWCCYEAWFAMRSVTREGFAERPFYIPKRYTVVEMGRSDMSSGVHLQIDEKPGWANKTLREAADSLYEDTIKSNDISYRSDVVKVFYSLDKQAQHIHRYFSQADDPRLHASLKFHDDLRQNASFGRLWLPCRNETLDLSRMEVDDFEAKLVSEELKRTTTTRTLNLGYNAIGDEGAELLANALEVNKTLRMLYLHRNRIGDAGAAKMAVALERNSSLGTLDMRRNSRMTNEGKRMLNNAVDMKPGFQLYV